MKEGFESAARPFWGNPAGLKVGVGVQWFPKFPAIFCYTIFAKMAGNLSYFAKKKLHPKIFVKFKFKLVILVLDDFDITVFCCYYARKEIKKW